MIPPVSISSDLLFVILLSKSISEAEACHVLSGRVQRGSYGPGCGDVQVGSWVSLLSISPRLHNTLWQLFNAISAFDHHL